MPGEGKGWGPVPPRRSASLLNCGARPPRLPRPPLPAIMTAVMGALLVSLRPKQWIKNGFVFAALVFDGQITYIPPPLGFVLFCLASSSIYLINDIRDFEEDRRHPTKCNRPLPSGRLPISLAWGAAAG